MRKSEIRHGKSQAMSTIDNLIRANRLAWPAFQPATDPDGALFFFVGLDANGEQWMDGWMGWMGSGCSLGRSSLSSDDERVRAREERGRKKGRIGIEEIGIGSFLPSLVFYRLSCPAKGKDGSALCISDVSCWAPVFMTSCHVSRLH